MREVYYHPKAPAEAREIYRFYRDVSEDLAGAFWADLEARIDYARRHPERHHFDRPRLRRANLKRFPIHFLFREFSDYIRVTVVRHDKRHPDFGSGRR